MNLSRFLRRSFAIAAILPLGSVLCDPSNAAGGDEEMNPERIQVTARIPEYQQTLSKILPQQAIIDGAQAGNDSLAAVLKQAPAISLNGQGGLMQAINIRGFSRWRIQTRVEGIPIYTERRAGTSVEFLPPSFLGQAYLTQGAASTQLGSGAIGGGIDLYLKQPTQQQMQLRYGALQDYREVHLQGELDTAAPGAILPSTDSFGWQLSHRHGNNSRDGAGNSIDDRFEQHSLALRHHSASGQLRETSLLYSTANNIAKASADHPSERITLYPDNNHFLGKLQFAWHNAAVYWHTSRLQTVVTRPGRRINSTTNQALDVGGSLRDSWQTRDWRFAWRAGIDARTGVTARERETSSSGVAVFERYNLDAHEWQSYAALEVAQQPSVQQLSIRQPSAQQRTAQVQSNGAKDATAATSGAWVGGARIAYHSQSNNLTTTAAQADTGANGTGGAGDSDPRRQTHTDANASAFIGYGYPLADGWQVSGYVSSGYRIPSLTERYFNGTTPRGQVLGNVDLRTETAFNIESNLHYQDQHLSALVAVFQQRINNYIERLRINPELRQYRNLDTADILGVNYQLQYQFYSGRSEQVEWQLDVGGQWLRGEDQAGNGIADISPAQHRLGLRFRAPASGWWHTNTSAHPSQQSFGELKGYLLLTHRQGATQPVAGELPIPRVTTVDLGCTWEINDQWAVALQLDNLTNQTYVTSRDDLAPLARGRDLQALVQYHF